MANMIWSVQQDAIFTSFVDGNGHLVVRARAGTGKTTTIVEAVKRWLAANPGKRALVCAFNTRIAEELRVKFGILFGLDAQLLADPKRKRDLEYALVAKGVEVKTLHAVGFASVRKFRNNLKVEDAKKVEVLRKDALALAVCGRSVPSDIVKMVAKLHTLGREAVPHASKLGDLTALAITHECEPDEVWTKQGYDANFVETKALAAMELAANVKDGDTIDFSDMIFLPCVNGWLAGTNDLVVVDEAQDMNSAQLEIAVGVSKAETGRIVVVGDDRQALYGFRGADSGSLDRLKSELSASELGLTTTYRCGKVIVNIARQWVPDFEAGENNPDGLVSELPSADAIVAVAGPGDFVLSRVNAPLVSIAMSLLRSGKRATVAGRDIGRGLTSLLRKMKGRSVPDLLAKIETWATRETARLEAQVKATSNGRSKALKAKAEAVRDQADMLISLADGAKNVDEVMARCEALFTDDGLGAAGVVTCSSVHRAKGLEADRVFVLSATLRETTDEEINICYVAVTRAKKELVYVGGAKREQ